MHLQDRNAVVERVVCKVLLGQPESGLEALSLSESTAASNQRSGGQHHIAVALP